MNNLDLLIKKKVAQFKRTGEHASQARIAIDLGIDPATLSLYKNDKVKHIDIELLKRMVQYFGVPSDQIFHIDFVEETATDDIMQPRKRNAG